ncbi:MAG: hydrogenase, partial [Pseudomonadota bacterium]
MKRIQSIDEFKDLQGRLVERGELRLPTIVIPAGTCGQASGANDLIRIAKREILKKYLTDGIRLRITGCHGFCEMEPSILVQPDGVFYPKVKMEDVPRIIQAVIDREILEDLLLVDPASGKRIAQQKDIPFFARQTRSLLARNERIDPIRIYHYIEDGGYGALARVLSVGRPEWVVGEVVASGLRGRGGAGFPTGKKWELLAAQPSLGGKVLVCNADEGDPGAYMDRSVLEGNPHSIIEGMLIGAYGTGASEG